MSKAKLFLVCVVWLVLLGAGAAIYRLWLVPSQEKKAEQKEAEVLEGTSASSRYKHNLNCGLDAFSGYAVLRSSEFRSELAKYGIKLNMKDDGADYNKRLNALANGELQFAAFPIDALLKACEEKGSLPATIISIIDETRGADAIVGYKKKFANVDSLNQTETRFVLVGDSPSETLVRVMLDQFDVDLIDDSSIVKVSSPEEVVERYKASMPSGNEVFVTWEPVVSELLSNPEMTRIFDSSGSAGYIVDAFVVNRDYLFKNRDLVTKVLESYFTARHAFEQPDRLAKLIAKDAEEDGVSLNPDQVKALRDGIAWKNTLANYTHFGLRNGEVMHIEDMIDRIRRILLNSKDLASDPTGGDASLLYYDQALRTLQEKDFFPGGSQISEDGEQLVALSDSQWKNLAEVGTLSVPSLIFARGTSKLTGRSERILDDLAKQLESWPRYYLMIRGNAGSRGDPEANKLLAKQRADAALQYLQSAGVPTKRMRAVEGTLSGNMSVSFVFGHQQY